MAEQVTQMEEAEREFDERKKTFLYRLLMAINGRWLPKGDPCENGSESSGPDSAE
jgi:hypothetical protein